MDLRLNSHLLWLCLVQHKGPQSQDLGKLWKLPSIGSAHSFLLALTSPAQGSPTPSFKKTLKNLNYLEPIGGSAPKLASETDLTRILRHHSQALSLKCPAQGSPTPSFRFVTHHVCIIKNPLEAPCPSSALTQMDWGCPTKKTQLWVWLVQHRDTLCQVSGWSFPRF